MELDAGRIIDLGSPEQPLKRGKSLVERLRAFANVDTPALAAHLKYRADIDGLRAVAVLSVVLFHAFPRWLAGGYVGVDIFFVISGFLISSILFSSLRAGTFSFADFYARRARRIFPSLVAVLVAVVLFGWYVLTPDEFSMLGKHIAAGSAFVGNVALWMETGYFDTAADAKPLLHLWSLGVEEQFYIVWPILLWAAWKKHWNLMAVCCVLGLVSFGTNVGAIDSHADAVFFLSFTRFWELIAGAALAYVSVVHGKTDVGAWFAGRLSAAVARNTVSIAGLLTLGWAIYNLDKSHAFPGWWAAVPVLGTVAVIAAGPHALVNRILLGNKLFVAIGLVSYPLYLWHWPLLAFGRILYGEMSKELRFGLIGAAILLATASYWLIEKRFRHAKAGLSPEAKRTQLTAMYVAVALCRAVGVGTYAGAIGARSNAHDVDELLQAQYDRSYPPRTFAKLAATGPNFFTRAGSAPGYTLFIGDSLVEHYGHRIEHVLNESRQPNYSIIFATAPGCPSLPNVFYVAAHTAPACAEMNRVAYQLAERPDVKKVVIGGDWERDLNRPSPRLEYRAGGTALKFDRPEAIETAWTALEQRVALLVRSKQVYIVLNSPKTERFSPKRMLEGSRFTEIRKLQKVSSVDISDFMQRTAATRERLIAIAQRHGAKVIDPVAALCEGNLCPAVTPDGRPYYSDQVHLRPFYVLEKAGFLDETMRAP